MSLNKLPVYEQRDTLFWREIWLDKKLIQRRFFLSAFLDDLKNYRIQLWWEFKAKLAKKLQDGMLDACPYCNNLILMGKWKKLDTAPPTARQDGEG